MRRLCAALARGSAKDAERAAAIGLWLDAPPAERMTSLGAYEAVFLTADYDEAGGRQLRKTVATQAASKHDPTVVEIAAREGERLRAAQARRADDLAWRRGMAALDLAAAVYERYDAAKRRAARLDYDDLIVKACAFLESDGGARWAHYKLDQGIEHILVDEAQDNNPDQWRVIDALAGGFFDGTDVAARRSSPRTLFIVGDEKQSIYGFQRATPKALPRKVRQLEDWVKDVGQPPLPKPELDVSFRSTASVLGLVDAVGTGLKTLRARPHRVERIGAPGRVELWPALAAAETPAPPPWTPPSPDAPPEQGWPERMAAVAARAIRSWVDAEIPLASTERP
ncbi:MAG: UvrD-helicase domain-containing protein, partial [Pseudomonadota bacterium]